ncbi:STAS domain-containing protein [Streptomyces sp. NPDC002889]|uniref:STAS domain-containing protein n=1 Tax=Streptomyces sp. NPDC002889 TaxID=3364669 RepID=UPI0036B67E0B
MSRTETNLNIEVVVHDTDTAILTIGGELDIDTATSLHHHMANQFVHGRRHLVLDLSDLQFMDSSGLNVLIKAGREARDTAGDLHLASPTPAVRRLFEITGLSLATPVHTNVEEALAAARSQSVPTTDHTGASALPTDGTA